MNRLFLFLVAVTLVVAGSIAVNGQVADRPRFTLPKDGQPGWIDIGQYYAMEDPVKAGRLLMTEAENVGLNLDDSSRVFKSPEPVYVSSGPVDSTEAYAFMRRIREEPQRSEPEMRAYLVRYRRSPTIREIATAMSHGVHHQRGSRIPALVVAMRSDQVAGFSSLPYVKWIRPYLPGFKVPRQSVFEKKADAASKIIICTIAGDQAAWRGDVTLRGGVINGALVAEAFYQATVPYDSIASITKLWWVVRIEPGIEISGE